MSTVNVRYHLLIGRGYARTIGDLSESLDLPRRVIEEAVQQARLNGVPVISGTEGLWLASSGQEAREAAERLHARAIHQIETAAALRRAGDALDATPLTLWDAA